MVGIAAAHDGTQSNVWSGTSCNVQFKVSELSAGAFWPTEQLRWTSKYWTLHTKFSVAKAAPFRVKVTAVITPFNNASAPM